jgi:hypothetical protein
MFWAMELRRLLGITFPGEERSIASRHVDGEWVVDQDRVLHQLSGTVQSGPGLAEIAAAFERGGKSGGAVIVGVLLASRLDGNEEEALLGTVIEFGNSNRAA